MGIVQGLNRNQIIMAPTLDETVAADNPVRVLDALVDSLILDGWGLIGKEIFAIDGTKIKASNNKKLNFSKKKLVDRIARIDDKIALFVTELENNDQAEEAPAQRVSVEDALASLKKRKEEYEACLSLLEITGDNEVSIIDPDARLMGNNRGGVEVSYNVQSAVDAKHCLAVEVQVTNNPSDHGQLSVMSKRVKKRLKIKRAFTVLADKGYYNGEDLFRCKKNKIITIVARQKAGREAPDKDYNADKFTYIEGKDCYICPLGQVLKRTGTRASRIYQNKMACEKCPEKKKCNTGVLKRFSVSQYQNVFTEADKRLADNLEL